MKRTFIAAFATTLSLSASAADFATPASPSVAATWTSLYGGLLLGATKPGLDERFGGARGYVTDTGFAGGALIGGSVQMGALVGGVEADIMWNTARRDYTNQVFVGDRLTLSAPTFATARARLGYAMGAFQPFVTGGLALGTFMANYTIAPFSASVTTTRTGWTLGAGVDYALTPNWRLRADYLYLNFGAVNGLIIAGDNALLDAHSLRLGLTYALN